MTEDYEMIKPLTLTIECTSTVGSKRQVCPETTARYANIDLIVLNCVPKCINCKYAKVTHTAIISCIYKKEVQE